MSEWDQLMSEGEDSALLLAEDSAGIKLTRYILLLSCVSTIGGFLFGYDTGVISGALVKLKEDFNLSDGQQEWIVGSAVGAAAVGALLGGLIANRFGRKPTIILAAVFFSGGSIVLLSAHSFLQLVFGRSSLGVGVGLASMIVPAYISECSPTVFRGKLVTMFGMTICLGQFIASVVCGGFSGVEDGWRWMLGLALVPSFGMGIGMLFLPESPRYMVQSGDIALAERTLELIMGTKNVQRELNDIRDTLSKETEYSESGFFSLTLKIFQTKSVSKALMIGCALQMFQQLSGINTVMYYSTTMIKMAGVDDDTTAIWLSCIPAFMNFAFAVVSLCLVERVARRKLLLSTLVGVVIGLAALGAAYYSISSSTAGVLPTTDISNILNSTKSCSGVSDCDDCVTQTGCGFCSAGNTQAGTCSKGNGKECALSYYTDDACYSPYSWTIIAAMVFYIACFSTGIGTLPWTINAEIYPMWARSYCLSLATLTNWLFNLLIAFTFLDLTTLLTKYGAFWFYSGLAAVGWVVFAVLLPETRGVPLEHVETLFS